MIFFFARSLSLIFYLLTYYYLSPSLHMYIFPIAYYFLVQTHCKLSSSIEMYGLCTQLQCALCTRKRASAHKHRHFSHCQDICCIVLRRSRSAYNNLLIYTVQHCAFKQKNKSYISVYVQAVHNTLSNIILR